MSTPWRTSKALIPRFVPQTTRPRSIEVAYWILAASAVIGAAISIVLQLVQPRDPIVIPAAVIVLVTIGAAAALVWVARGVRRGAQWARVTTTILAPTAVPYLAGNQISNLVTLVAQVTAVVLVWVPASNAYVRAVKSERAKFEGG